MGPQVIRLAVAIGICLGAGALGAVFSAGQNLADWYEHLNKPSFNPPGWVFGPVWTVLYILMGVAAFLVWQKGLAHRPVRIALGLFAVHLLLNAAWSPLFFGWHQIGWALVDIGLLWAAILATIIRFYPVSRPAAWCLAPYLAWVSFASILNLAIWRLNP